MASIKDQLLQSYQNIKNAATKRTLYPIQQASNFIRNNPTPMGYISQRFPQVNQNISRFRNLDIASTVTGGATKSYLDTQGQSPFSPKRILAQNFPVVGAVQNVLSKKPTFFSEQVQRAIPGRVGQLAGFAGEMVLPGVGGELRAGQGIVKGIVKPVLKSALRGGAYGASQAESLADVPGSVGRGALFAGALGSVGSALRLKGNANGFDMGRNSNTKWEPEDIKELDAVTDMISKFRKMSPEQMADADVKLTSLARGYLPTEIIEKIAGQYGSNSRGMLKAITDELNKSVKYQMNSGAIQMGIAGKKTIGRSANVESGLRESMSTAASAQDAETKLNQFVSEYAKKADKRQLADLRAGLTKELTNLTGGSGDYKKDYAIRVALRNDSEIGGLVRSLENHIDNIDAGRSLNIKTNKKFEATTLEKTSFPEGGASTLPLKPNVVNAEASPKTVEKLREKAAKEEFNTWNNQYKATTLSPTQLKNQGIKSATGLIKTNTVSPASRSPEQLKDITGYQGHMRDVFRNFKQVYGDRFDEVKRSVLDPLDKSKGEYVDMNESWAGKLKKDIVDGLGIKKKSKESAAVQMYGEGQINQQELTARFGPEKSAKIQQADQWFRKSYDELIDTINKTRKQIYPNSPEKWIAKRKDYYRHFREMQEGIGALFNIFDTPSAISSNLAGISENMKPKAKFLSLAQQRKGPTTEIDAVGGFIDYIKQASYATHIDKHADRFRALSTELANGTGDSKNVNNFILYLNRFADDLTGKTNAADRFLQEIIPGGRTAFKAINWVNNRVKGNAVIGNVSSALSQIMNVPQGIADAGIPNSLKGIGRTLAGIFTKNPEIQKSTFVKERYSDPFSKFDEGILADAGKFAKWMTGALDNVGTRVIWNSQFEKAKGLNIPNPIKYADDVTRSLVAGRGIGEVPLMQKARITQLIAPFQLEVQNLWWVLKDMGDQKAVGKLATFFIANHFMNSAIKSIRGSDVTFDPIQSIMDGYESFQQEDDKGKGALKFAGRQAGEVLSNVPGGQSLAAMYPEYGATVGEAKLPTRRDFFGQGNPVRQGSGILAVEGLKDPLYKIIPPFGGAQLKKTIEGVQTLAKGYEGKENAVKYPVEKNTSNIIKGTVFGKSALPETREYYDKNRRPLAESQSKVFAASNDKKGSYKTIIDKRKENADDDSAKDELKGSNNSSLLKNNKLYVLQDNGDVKTVKIIDPIKPPTLSGIQEIDKTKISSYKSSITARIKDLGILLDNGAMSREDVLKELQGLKALQSKVSKGSKKKFISDAELLSAYNKVLKSANAPPRNKKAVIKSSVSPIQLKRQVVRKLR